MYKCTDCGQEFETKPDYCDCGNDKFEEIIPKIVTEDTSPTNISPSLNDLPKINSNFSKEAIPEQRTKHNNLNLDIPSVLIFLSCIILSILSVIYIGKDSLESIEKNKNNPQKNNTTLVKNNNVPNINKIWKDSIPMQQKVIKQIAPVQTTISIQNNPVHTINTQRTKINTIIPKISTPKTKAVLTKQVPKTVKKIKQTSVKQIQSKPTANTNSSAKQQTPDVQKSLPKNTVKQPQVNTAQLQQDLANYKIALRNKLANSIAFENIVGDGFCSVSFKVDIAGNLTNRRFSVQSDNDSLNNAVYSAIMNNPTFKSPPQGYSNQTLTFSVKMYGGRFKVTLN